MTQTTKIASFVILLLLCGCWTDEVEVTPVTIKNIQGCFEKSLQAKVFANGYSGMSRDDERRVGKDIATVICFHDEEYNEQ